MRARFGGRCPSGREEDHLRHRTTLVARLTAAGMGMRLIPPLFDVVLLGTTGESWTLAGYERVASGALQQEFFLGQSWLVTPAPLEDLRNAENEWARLAKLLAELQQREK